jgi:hypothetical protein
MLENSSEKEGKTHLHPHRRDKAYPEWGCQGKRSQRKKEAERRELTSYL